MGLRRTWTGKLPHDQHCTHAHDGGKVPLRTCLRDATVCALNTHMALVEQFDAGSHSFAHALPKTTAIMQQGRGGSPMRSSIKGLVQCSIGCASSGERTSQVGDSKKLGLRCLLAKSEPSDCQHQMLSPCWTGCATVERSEERVCSGCLRLSAETSSLTHAQVQGLLHAAQVPIHLHLSKRTPLQ